MSAKVEGSNQYGLPELFGYAHDMETTQLAADADALAHPIRLRVIELLRGHADGMSAGEVAARLDVKPTTLTLHLSVLTRAALIKPTPAGASVIYSYQSAAGADLVDRIRALLTD